MNTTRDSRKRQGLCIYCGIYTPRAGYVSCEKCAERFRLYFREYRRLHPLPERNPEEDGRGKTRTFDYIVTAVENGRDVFKGSAKDAADFIGCAPSLIYMLAGDPKHRVRGIYKITKERLTT